MGLTIDEAEGPGALRLSGPLTIYEAAQAKELLLAHPGAAVDLSAVEACDGAGLQVLLLAHRDAGVRLCAPSAEVAAALRLTGLGHLVEAAP